MHPSPPTYEETYFRDRETWIDFRMEADLLLSLARIAPESRVLEIGCGSGELLSRLARRSGLAAGVDISPVGLDLARRKRGVRALCSRAETLPFGPESFDAILAQHLIEHLEDPLGALREWRRVLRPGGTLALVTPNNSYPDGSIFYDPSHVRLFTQASLRSVLEEAGFRVTHLSTLFPYLGCGRIARSASIRLAPLARHLPGLASTGRSLMAAATRAPQ